MSWNTLSSKGHSGSFKIMQEFPSTKSPFIGFPPASPALRKHRLMDGMSLSPTTMAQCSVLREPARRDATCNPFRNEPGRNGLHFLERRENHCWKSC